jgi:carbonic anhydrase/acetyltransferase-like protein (isoleucine patch superfamily)
VSDTTVLAFGRFRPEIDDDVFVAPTATVIGRVRIERGSGIWFGAVVRGDLGEVHLGPGCVVEDNCVIHANTRCGAGVLIGHSAVVESSTIGDGALIGSGCLLFDGVEVGEGAMIAAGSVVRGPIVIPPGVLVAGNPARVKKEIGGAAAWWVRNAAPTYGRLAAAYRDGISDEDLAELSRGPQSEA